MRRVKSEQPETLAQAKRWDGRKHRYLAMGWCYRCACQAAWGHQIGFTKVDPPCDPCIGKPVPDGCGQRAYHWSRGTKINPE